MQWILILVIFLIRGGEGCSLPTELNGTWTTTNLGTVTIQAASPQFSTTVTFTGTSNPTATEFDCLLVDGDNYVLQSNTTLTVFSGTTNVLVYMCIAFTETSSNTYIYYLNSAVEAGLNNLRLVGLPTTTAVTMASQICTATLDIAEYNTMVRDGVTGYELGTVQCPTPLLGLFLFTYSNSGVDYCTSVNATLNTCNNQSLTSILVDDSACDTANPFYSNGGVLGCISSLQNTSTETYYATLYNGDSTVDNSAFFRFSCVAITSNTNGTVYLSVKPTACEAGQTSMTVSSPGATMILNPLCVPTTEDTSQDYTVLIILLVVFGVLLIVIIIIIVCCYFRYKKKKKEKAREKKMLITEDHPLGEVSIALDTPARMDAAILESGNETFRSPRRKKGQGTNPLGESSMNLDFTGRQWANSSKPPSRMAVDPFTEMETGAIVPLSPYGAKSSRSLRSRQSSFVGKSMLNGDARKPLPITDKKPEELNALSLMNGGVTNKRGEMVRAKTMIKAPSIKSGRSIKAPSLMTESLKSNGAVVRVGSIKGKPGSKPDKMTRSATSTRIGSVTKRSMQSKKKMDRSHTVIVPTKVEDGETELKSIGPNGFLSGEMNPVESLSARSAGGKSKKSLKSTKSKTSTARSLGSTKSFKRKMTGIPNYFRAMSIV